MVGTLLQKRVAVQSLKQASDGTCAETWSGRVHVKQLSTIEREDQRHPLHWCIIHSAARVHRHRHPVRVEQESLMLWVLLDGNIYNHSQHHDPRQIKDLQIKDLQIETEITPPDEVHTISRHGLINTKHLQHCCTADAYCSFVHLDSYLQGKQLPHIAD